METPNTDDLADHPFAQFIAAESFVSSGERAWLRWVAQVEKLLGHDLDGDQDRDGYSLGYAHDAFEWGYTPAEYVADVREAQAAIAKAVRA